MFELLETQQQMEELTDSKLEFKNPQNQSFGVALNDTFRQG